MLCTLANLKAHLGIASADTEYDTVLNAIIAGVSDSLARIAGRVAGAEPCLEMIEDLVVTLNVPPVRTYVLWLPAYPVIEITEVKEALYGDFAAATALTANTDYQLDAGVGGLYRIGWWLPGVQTVRVTATGGYTPAEAWVSADTYVIGDRVIYGGIVYKSKTGHTGVATLPSADATNWEATDEIVLPADIRQWAVMQCAHEFFRRTTPGASGQSAQGANVSWIGAVDLLPIVRRGMIDGYGRRVG